MIKHVVCAFFYVCGTSAFFSYAFCVCTVLICKIFWRQIIKKKSCDKQLFTNFLQQIEDEENNGLRFCWRQDTSVKRGKRSEIFFINQFQNWFCIQPPLSTMVQKLLSTFGFWNCCAFWQKIWFRYEKN